MNPRRKIIVSPPERLSEHRALFSLLSEAFPVTFSDEPLTALQPVDGVIAWHPSREMLRFFAERGTSVLAIASGPRQQRRGAIVQVDFGGGAHVERCFRRARMHDSSLMEFVALRPGEAEETICSIDGRPAWITRALPEGELSLSGFEPPAVADGATLYHYFNRFDWLRLLPFLHYVLAVTRDEDWQPPPLRACFMFDDPNLHWGTYGFIDFAAIARHAERNDYHAAFAMVPADVWYTHAQTAALFRRSGARLSLLMHGNDHNGAELLRHTSAETRRQLLAQALRRIAKFERLSGVHVARVMAPPHGAFDLTAAESLLELDYEALCISRASLLACNRLAHWPAAFGRNIVEWLAPGLPVIPRHVLGFEHEDSYRLAAFLGQPIIPHGHHRDCAEGLEKLADLAGVINSLGDVHWCNLTATARTNYLVRHDGDILVVKMLARRVVLPPPRAGIDRLVVVRPWLLGEEPTESKLVCTQHGVLRHAGLDPHVSREIPITAGEPIDLRSPVASLVNPSEVEPPSQRLWPIVRRVLAEGRDRCSPLLPHRRRLR